MGAQLTTLTPADRQRFERDGYLVVRQAFARADGLAMERNGGGAVEDAHGIRRDDRSSWRQLPGDLKAAKRDRLQAAILTGRVRGVLDDLLGPGGLAATASERHGSIATLRDRFRRSHPWLMALTGQAP